MFRAAAAGESCVLVAVLSDAAGGGSERVDGRVRERNNNNSHNKTRSNIPTRRRVSRERRFGFAVASP